MLTLIITKGRKQAKHCEERDCRWRADTASFEGHLQVSILSIYQQ